MSIVPAAVAGRCSVLDVFTSALQFGEAILHEQAAVDGGSTRFRRPESRSRLELARHAVAGDPARLAP
jgi:hypothetical protein